MFIIQYQAVEKHKHGFDLHIPGGGVCRSNLVAGSSQNGLATLVKQTMASLLSRISIGFYNYSNTALYGYM